MHNLLKLHHDSIHLVSVLTNSIAIFALLFEQFELNRFLKIVTHPHRSIPIGMDVLKTDFVLIKKAAAWVFKITIWMHFKTMIHNLW